MTKALERFFELEAAADRAQQEADKADKAVYRYLEGKRLSSRDHEKIEKWYLQKAECELAAVGS